MSRKSGRAVVAVAVAVAAAVTVVAAAVAVAAAEAEAVAVDVAVADVQLDLQPIAIAVGEAWAVELVQSLRAVDRDVVGAWPGTLREARMRIRIALRSKLELHLIDELAHVAYLAARRGWQEVSQPDPEA